MSSSARPSVPEQDDSALPSLEEVAARFAADRLLPFPPWLTPEGLAAAREAVDNGIPEVSGPLDGVIPDDED
jgi:hypothetical protein